ncbi:hypothetical protein [Guptibacillus algicola]|nr:hypothetical protein [Alkalihalobacillus algicola]MCA0986141.1 hypothetical protein [Alkalihalobacillus algicola]
MLTINLLFIKVGITVQEKTVEEEIHYHKVKEDMTNRTTGVMERQPWLF